MRRKPLFTLICVALLAAGVYAPSARAQSAVYGGIGIGYAGVELEQTAVFIPELDVLINRDLEGTAINVEQFLGWRIGKYFAIEGGYFKYDSVNDSALISVQPAISANYSIRLDGFEFYGLGIYPLNEDLELFAKAGLVHWDSEFRVQSELGNFNGNDKGDDLSLGFGLTFLTSGPFQVRFEAELPDIGAVDLTWNFTVAGIYSFKLGR